jgi:hypothetical protein
MLWFKLLGSLNLPVCFNAQNVIRKPMNALAKSFFDAPGVSVFLGVEAPGAAIMAAEQQKKLD